MKNKILLSYFTKGGATEDYANVIEQSLKKDGFSVEKNNLANNIPNIKDFDVIILGTGVRMFRVYRRWKKILKQKELKNKQLFMYLSSGTAIEDPDKAVEKYLNPLVEKYQLKPKLLVSLPGKIPEKWAKLDEEKEKFSPEKAKTWAKEISNNIKI